MAGRRIINEEDAERCLQGVKRARITLREWAQANGVDGQSLHAWEMIFERRKTGRTRQLAPKLVELIPTAFPISQVCFVEICSDFEFDVPDSQHIPGDSKDDAAGNISTMQGDA